MFEIEDKSVFFLQWHIENSFKEIFNKFVINNIEWMEGDEVRAYGVLRDSNIIVLFPVFDENAEYYLPPD